MTRRRARAAAAVLVAVTSVAWLDSHHAVRQANELYDQGKYEDAAAAYNAALVDKPDSPELHFNLGDATYKQGKYEDAVSAFQKVETAGDPARTARVAYNVGNAQFRQGQALEQSDPQKAMSTYADALVSYRRALASAPADEDVKFNYEFVTKKIDELQKKLDEQKKQQEQQQEQKQQQQGDQQKDQQQQDQQQQQAGQDQQQKDEQQQQNPDQQQNAENGDQQQKQQQQQQQQQQADQQPSEDQKGEQQQQGAQAGEPQDDQKQPSGENGGEAVAAGEKKDGELSIGEAAAILDSQRGEEVSPEDVIKKLQGARVAEPAEDW